MTSTLKLNPIRDRKWLDHLRDQPCIITGLRGHPGDPVEAVHIGTLGKGMKRGDDEALPVSHNLHKFGHDHGEITMFRNNLPNDILRDALRALAREMYREWK